MAAGVPVIATKVGGTPELVEDGATGLLVPPRDSAALGQAMTLLLEHPETARRIGAAGRSDVTSRFSIDKMVHDTQSLYVKLLSSTRARVGHREAALS
jgi:glycosyltransferase involved in cell wall biosynthesis